MATNREMAPPPASSCIICTEKIEEADIILPCRICSTEYCRECLRDIFVGATEDSTRMPPRCCTFLQIHTAITALTDKEADDYRAKLEEWITLDKVYCPSPTCSAFIPERMLPSTPTSMEGANGAPTLQAVLSEVPTKITTSPPARFFRGELDITQAPGYTEVVSKHIDLTAIQSHLNANRYASAQDLTSDMTLMVSNAKIYNGLRHPISKTADELFALYTEELSVAVDTLVSMHCATIFQDMFGCPKCHIGICTKCKQIEHGTAPCNTTAQDHELAMLETFRYKRCPLCKHAIRKMFGCSHMQCICGAHWCYWCQRSINECDGGCEAREESDDEEEDDLDDEELSEDDEDDGDQVLSSVPVVAAADNASSEGANEHNRPRLTSQLHPIAQPDRPSRVENLDAGGGRRWAETDFDFGDEPGEDGTMQIWSCTHEFELYYSKGDGHNHGDESRVECNRCFAGITPSNKPTRGLATPSSTKPPKKRGSNAGTTKAVSQLTASLPSKDVATEKQAWECGRCFLVACVECKVKYKNKGSSDG